MIIILKLKIRKRIRSKTREEDGCLDYAFSVELHNDKIIRIH